MPGIDYIKQCRSDIDRLIEQSPPIPPDILNSFDKKILQDPSGEEVLFSVPPILKLEPVNVFRTEIDEEQRIRKAMEMKEIARKQKESILKEENDKIEAAIKAHETRRQSIRGEVELESIARKLQEEQKEKEDKHFKRQNLTLGDLTKRIGRFKDILTEDFKEDKPPTPPAAIQIVIQDISENEIEETITETTDLSNNDTN